MVRPRKIPWDFLAAVALLTLAIIRDARLLMQYSVPVGIDGYYYIIQINALLTHGRLYFPTRTPLVFYALAGLTYVFGNPVLVAKLTAVIAHALLGVGLFCIIRALTDSGWLAVFGLLLALFSTLHLYLIAEYLKYLVAVTLLVWAAWCWIKLNQTKQRRWLVVVALFLSGALLSHRSTLVIVSAVLLCYFLSQWFTSRRRSQWSNAAPLVITMACWLVPALIAWQSIVSLPLWISTEISSVPHWPLATVAVVETFVIAFTAPVCLLLSAEQRERRDRLSLQVFATIALTGLIFTLNPFLDSQAGWNSAVGRLGGLSYIQIAVLLPAVFWLLGKTTRAFFVAAVIFPLLVLAFRSKPPRGLDHDYLTRRVELVQGLILQREQVDSSAFVIAPHGDQFVITSILGMPSQQKPPANERLYWLLNSVIPLRLPSDAVVLIREADGRSTALVKSEQLRQIFSMMNGDERRSSLESNPHLKEPFEKTAGFTLDQVN